MGRLMRRRRWVKPMDCLKGMAEMKPRSVDTIITDPPYGLEFMGKDWDRGIPGKTFWRAALRVAKPGAMLLAFGGTRTHHRLMCAIEDAGWEIRDCLMWLYGSGFPKSHDISKAIDKKAGKTRRVVGSGQNFGASTQAEGKTGYGDYAGEWDVTAPATDAARLWDGWGTALKPAWEPIILAMKPCDGTFAANAIRHGVTGLNVDGGRIGTDENCARKRAVVKDTPAGFGKGQAMGGDGSPGGRWPANLILDEEAGAMLDAQTGELKSGAIKAGGRAGTSFSIAGEVGVRTPHPRNVPGSSGGASRFFYCAKASRKERDMGLEGMPESRSDYRPNDPDESSIRTRLHGSRKAKNAHPTVKPLALMRYLVKLTAPPTGGLVLDPFTGSGTTGMACVLEGRRFVGFEKDTEHCKVANRRIAEARRKV